MDKKALKKAYKERELKAVKESLPMKAVDFFPLFDFLDNELSEKGCQHDFSLLESYCKQKGIDFSVLAEWFKEQGGFCDCEIIANAEEQFEYFTKQTPKIRLKTTQTVQREKLNTLTTDFDFSIKRVPAPWVLIATSQGDRTIYQFQVGKKSDFPVIIESDFPIDKLSDDNFLHNYWITKTELDNELEFTIDRQSIQGFEIVQVRTKRWLPIFVFAYRQGMKWCLVLRTETTRVRNDVRELEKLLKEV